VLVLSPLLVGLAISFFSNADGKLTYVGLGNYLDILTGSGGALECPGSFWFVLAVTVLWTAANISLHVLLGLTLALLLNQVQQRQPRLSRAYRVVLILPWAVPSYVTALTWKAMFHRQFGAINALLETLGLPAIDWFSRWTTAFSANLLTNVWLGFPFMMVVSLGALAAVPGELYQAAAVDGATRFQQLRLITLPMLRPSLGPAIAMGAAWTFNMFNVVFLVSGGEPGGTTEILISEAYRWAFTRSAQYGYAAAYAVLIFGALWLASRGRLSAVSSEALV
jgi:arabinogalactan oligomer/maltooligosaccharide transport system permease protein